MYWRSGTTRAWVEQYLAILVARIAVRHRRLQRDLDRIASIWAGPAHLHYCIGGRGHWQVPATADAVAAVARHAGDPDVGVRHAIAAALGQAAPHVEAAMPALRVGITDADARVRMLTARALAHGLASPPLRAELLAACADPVWTVRWYAAAALAHLGDRDRAIEVLLASLPRPGLALDDWLGAAQRVEPNAALSEAIAWARSDLATTQALWSHVT
ncbi:MAG: hypothetical protein K8W52_39180 [Deltaproteobacteria bacterium]|nr:hypothetical protein [Deltaproteobacteria bacterium]